MDFGLMRNLKNQYIKTAQNTYLKNFNSFLFHRLKYYTDLSVDSTGVIDSRILKYLAPRITRDEFNKKLQEISNTRSRFIILITTKDRKQTLNNTIDSVTKSTFTDWHIVLVDNGNDGTCKLFENDPKITAMPLNQITGCAFLARNIGLDVIDLAKRRNPINIEQQYLIILDSDDTLTDRFSLEKLSRLIDVHKIKPPAMVHGFCNYVYNYEDGSCRIGTYPEYFTNNLPEVTSLSGFFNKGPNILSAAIRLDYILNLRYPQEFSFEDNALNHKLLYRINENRDDIVCGNFSVVTKVWGFNSIAGENDKTGNSNLESSLCGIKVTGERAKIVSYLKLLDKFFIDVGL